MDFEITHNDGSLELLEVKGYETDVWRLKWKLLHALYAASHPEIKISIIKKKHAYVLDSGSVKEIEKRHARKPSKDGVRG